MDGEASMDVFDTPGGVVTNLRISDYPLTLKEAAQISRRMLAG